MKTFKQFINEVNVIPIGGMHSSGEADHSLDNDEKGPTAEYMKLEYGVDTLFHDEDGANNTLSYHALDKNKVRDAIIHHYYNDIKSAKEFHPHLFGRK